MMIEPTGERAAAMGNPAVTSASKAYAARRLGVTRTPATVLACLLLAVTLLAAADPKPIVNGDHASVVVDRQMLRAIFTMRIRAWPDGAPVRVFVLPDDNDTHDRFCREQLGMYSYVLRDLWDRLEFTGTGLAPTVVHSLDEMRARVQATPGAIGYAEAPDGPSRADGARMAFGYAPAAGGAP